MILRRKESRIVNVSINNFVLVTQAQRRRYRMDSDREGRELTNHSGKVTCCTTLFDDQFDDSIVRSRSGHTSDAVNVYKRQTIGMKKKVSDCLQALKPRNMVPSCTDTKANLSSCLQKLSKLRTMQ